VRDQIQTLIIPAYSYNGAEMISKSQKHLSLVPLFKELEIFPPPEKRKKKKNQKRQKRRLRWSGVYEYRDVVGSAAFLLDCQKGRCLCVLSWPSRCGSFRAAGKKKKKKRQNEIELLSSGTMALSIFLFYSLPRYLRSLKPRDFCVCVCV
jgi:hypothetical protein